MKNFRTTKIGINDDERTRRAATLNRPDFFVVCSKLPELSRLLLPECEEFRVLRTDRLWCEGGRMQFQTTQYDSAHFQSLGKVTIVTKAHLSLIP
jgi:hypothetical protein